MKAHDHPVSSSIVHQGAALNIESIPLAVLDEPLDYIHADHSRKRKICAALLEMASARNTSRRAADQITAFLTGALKLHHADEDESLFPALRRRLVPEDNLGDVLARLGEDHRRSKAMIETVAKVLTQNPAADPVRLSTGEYELLQVYANAELQHLALENGVVMGIARIRLTRSDLRSISEGMKSRRGVTH
jgi:hemerythrin-like domain-containing protein